MEPIDSNINEVWRAVPGFDGYEVSDRGRLRSWRCSLGRRTKPWMKNLEPIKGGYLLVQLQRDGKANGRLIHRLVLEAFIGLAPAGHEGSHMDGKPGNNCLDNLAWKTRPDNQRLKIDHGTHLARGRHPRARLSDDAVQAIRAAASSYGYRQRLAQAYGVSVATISDVRNGRSWKEEEHHAKEA